MWLVEDMIDKAFPFRIAMLKRCFSQAVSLLSSVFSEIRFPISLTMIVVKGPKTPEVSIATGLNLNLLTRLGYLALLAFSAFAAAEPALMADSFTELSLKVLTHVASQQRALPLRKEKVVIPSSLFPSPRSRPTGSSSVGVPADLNAQLIMSVMAACRGCLLVLSRSGKNGNRSISIDLSF